MKSKVEIELERVAQWQAQREDPAVIAQLTDFSVATQRINRWSERMNTAPSSSSSQKARVPEVGF